jgi:outer membrane receptor protein involved in Fe transport
MKRWLVCTAMATGFGVMNVSSVLAQEHVVVDRVPADESVAANAAMLRRITITLDGVSLRQAVASVAARAGVRIVYEGTLDATRPTVFIRAKEMPLKELLGKVLTGTPLRAIPRRGDIIALRTADDARSGGIVKGTVRDVATREPLGGVMVTIDGATRGVLTGADGVFRVSDVSVGNHTMVMRRVGYRRVSKVVQVVGDEVVTLDVSLENSANTLDQVVVTGTVIPTELKAVPNAMTVITAKQIEERGVTRMAELFRGEVPGMFVMNSGLGGVNGAFGGGAMFSRGATALSNKSTGVTTLGGNTGKDAAITNTIKTYLDGVELTDPNDLYLLDPKSIERIEILTGPQASTLYGSNAINGVMQIFTKRGTTSKPQLTLNLSSGWVENNFSNARTPRHDDNVQLSGMEGRLAYHMSGSWNYMGSWTPGVRATLRTVSGGARLELPTPAGRVTNDVSLRRTMSRNTTGALPEQGFTALEETGARKPTTASNGIGRPSVSMNRGQTFGFTVGYVPTTWWSHELQLGQDVVDRDYFNVGRGFTHRGDTALQINLTHTERSSLRYATTLRTPVAPFTTATITAGADAWQARQDRVAGSPSNRFVTNGFVRAPGHNTGGFLQTQLGVSERLFFTYGFRAEFNPAIGDKAKVLPGRYGVAYAQEFGSVTGKLRGSYGRSIRPPDPYYQLGLLARKDPNPATVALTSVYGDFYTQLPNPEIVPEYQQGGEGGLELYLGSRGSLVITRYNQTVEGLIDLVGKADSVRSFSPYPIVGEGMRCDEILTLYEGSPNDFCSSQDASGYAYIAQRQYLNIGSIRNQGWEFQGNANFGRVTARGTYSWTKSRVIGITPKFRALFDPLTYPQYQVGAPFRYLPEHTWAWGMTYAHAATTVGLTVTGVGRTTVSTDDFYLRNLADLRLLRDQLNMNPSSYIATSSGYALAGFTASHRVSARWEGTLNVQNLFDQYRNDVSSWYATMGRQTTLGLRLRL